MIPSKISRLLNLVYPEGITCNACGRELDDGEREFSVCTACADSMRIIKNNPIAIGSIDVYSCFEYDGIVRKYILDNKDFAKPYLSKYVAKYLYKLYKEFNLHADLVCYVPSSPSALRKRGYDAMKLVAEEFSLLSEIPVSHLLFRVDGTDQTKLDATERSLNAKNKFLSRGGFDGHVILIDDVTASGATLKECGRAVLFHGAKSLTALTFARV